MKATIQSTTVGGSGVVPPRSCAEVQATVRRLLSACREAERAAGAEDARLRWVQLADICECAAGWMAPVCEAEAETGRGKA
jgi:hypothetical protein